MLLRFLFAIAFSLSALLSQVNMKLVAIRNPNLLETLSTNSLIHNCGLILRIAIPAGVSLCFTVLGYTKFGFLQLMIMQALFYPMAFFIDHFLFKEIFSIRMFSASIFISIGVFLAIRK
jgi:hypothetical protein